ncbi:aminoacyl-histidine dipeptidase, partial [Campylobacter coli]
IKCEFKEEGEFEICDQNEKLLNTINAFAHGVRAYDEHLSIVHKEYAKFVLIVKDFLDGLVNKMFDINVGTNNAYGDKKTNPES